jgi:bleomycin hydrolase
MRSSRLLPLAVCGCTAWLLAAGLTPSKPIILRYLPAWQDPTDREIEERAQQRRSAREAQTAALRQAQDRKAEAPRELRCDLSGVEKPASPDVCHPPFHFPPQRQFHAGNCWAYSATSFFESEVARLSGRRLKLSEMYTVYFDYVEKARRYVRERGASYFDGGSEGPIVPIVWARYGIVPAEAYRGTLERNGRHDDDDLLKEMKGYLEYIHEHDLWDEELVVSSIRLILDKYLGRPPERFTYEQTEMTPAQFLTDVLQLKLTDYVNVMSTLASPPHEFGPYDVSANWWHAEYYNVPLDEFYRILYYATAHGYTARLNGDVTEPGYSGCDGVAIVPNCDIPREYIDAQAREFRIANKSTDDDHDIHLLGLTQAGDCDWFLIKDSSNEGQCGPLKGYLFYREDYVKLKMLTYTVHRDALKAVVAEF